jgi:hypothetical protein
MPVTILSHPDRWVRKSLTGNADLFSKIFSVQAPSESEVLEWARVFAMTDQMRSQGDDVTRFQIQKIGAVFGVHFYWEVSK